MSRALPSHHPLALELWARDLAAMSASTRECYLRDVRQIAELVSNRNRRPVVPADLLDLDAHRLEEFVSTWQADDVAASTIRRRLVSLRTYVRWLAVTMGATGPILVARHPRIALPSPNASPTRDLGELGTALGRNQDWSLARDLAAMTLVAHLGLSTSELAALDPSCVGDGFLIVRRGGDGMRMMDLGPAPAEAVRQYRAMSPKASDGDPLWLNSRGGRMSVRSLQLALRRVRLLVGWPPPAVAGSFRRQRVVAMAAEGHPVDEIALLMGIGVETVVHHLRS